MKKQKETVRVPEEIMAEIRGRESKGKRIASRVINILLAIAIVIAAICTYASYVSTSGNGVPNLFGIRFLSVQTDSMYPNILPGDMIFDTAIPDTSKLQVGDVITYWTVIDGKRTLNTHRIVGIYDGGGYLIFETKGDKNEINDALTVHESEIIGQWKGARAPGLGKALDYLQTSKGFLLAVVIPTAAFFLFHLVQFFMVLFEYNAVKNKLIYEQERSEKMVEEKAQTPDRAQIEEEVRQQLREEIAAELKMRMELEQEVRKELREELQKEQKNTQEAEPKTEPDQAQEEQN